MKITLIFITALLLISCEKETVDEKEIETTMNYADDTFIFGHFYGECIGENCIEVFKIEDGKIYEDTSGSYPNGTDDNFAWLLLENEKFEKAKSFPEFFPSELLSEIDQVIGMPDAGDWGGYIIGKMDDDELRIWLIDTMVENIPEYLHEYNDRIENVIDLMQ